MVWILLAATFISFSCREGGVPSVISDSPRYKEGTYVTLEKLYRIDVTDINLFTRRNDYRGCYDFDAANNLYLLDTFEGTITVFDENINVVLKALANSYDTNILSAPRITTVNNRPAEIKIIQKLPWAEPEVEMSDQGIAITWNINFEEVGIILKVTPTITDDGKIVMELEPEVSEKVDDYQLTVVQGTTEIPYTVPVIDKRSADTKVVIGNGQTLIIGGLIKEKNTKGVTKVPILGDIPLLGWFFKSKKDTKDKTELLIFVSPTIVTPQVMAYMKKKEELGVGKWYFDERKKEKKRIEEISWMEKKDLVFKIESLEKKIKDISSQREKLEKILEFER